MLYGILVCNRIYAGTAPRCERVPAFHLKWAAAHFPGKGPPSREKKLAAGTAKGTGYETTFDRGTVVFVHGDEHAVARRGGAGPGRPFHGR